MVESRSKSARSAVAPGTVECARAEHDALSAAVHRLEGALAAAAPGRQRKWSRRVMRDLEEVEVYLARHVSSSEGAGGLFVDIEGESPAFARRIGALRDEHKRLLEEASGLRDLVRRSADNSCSNFDKIRHQAADLLNALRQHRALETDLIFEAYCTDIGAGD